MRKKSGGGTAKEKKNYMLLIIFMVLIFNSLSFPETKKQQHMYYLWQAQKNHAVVTPFFSRGLCNRARYTAEPPLPPDPAAIAADTGAARQPRLAAPWQPLCTDTLRE